MVLMESDNVAKEDGVEKNDKLTTSENAETANFCECAKAVEASDASHFCDDAKTLLCPAQNFPALKCAGDFAPECADEHAPHESTPHEDAQVHHHHSHAAHSHHAGGHHLLQVEDLCVSFRMYDESQPFFRAKQRDVEVLHNLSIAVHAGEVVAVVGASGSGKTLLADAVFGLFEPNSTVSGRIWFDGQRMDAAGLAALRGHGLSLVPQSVSHLDPMMRVGKQVEGFANGLTKAERRTRRQQLFERYGLDPEVARLYPHELSGGMARRVLLCCALMDDPRVIVADEPTPGLDLDLAVRALEDFRAFADAGGGVLLITHDIELALRVADRVAVFKDGTVVEETAVANFVNPSLLRHEFTRQLWRALPEHDFAAEDAERDKEWWDKGTAPLSH